MFYHSGDALRPQTIDGTRNLNGGDDDHFALSVADPAGVGEFTANGSREVKRLMVW